jgi:hypothetical protein
MSEPEVVIHNGLFIFDKNIFGVIPEEKLDNHNQPQLDTLVFTSPNASLFSLRVLATLDVFYLERI